VGKTILLILFCGFSSLSFAQVFEPGLKKLADKAAAQNFQKQNKVPLLKILPTPSITFPSAIKLEPGVYVLPIDNMPCFVPDTKDIATMPNALNYFQPPSAGRMPGTGGKKSILIPPKKNSD